MKGIPVLFICIALLLCSGCVQKENNETGRNAVANQTVRINETTIDVNETIARVNETTAKINESPVMTGNSPVECVTLMAPGSIEEKAEAMPSNIAEVSARSSSFVATINTPRPGDLLTGNNEHNFRASVAGGKAPYSYSWTSNIDGVLSHNETFSLKPSDLQQGQHTIILQVNDSSGQMAQASVIVSDIAS